MCLSKIMIRKASIILKKNFKSHKLFQNFSFEENFDHSKILKTDIIFSLKTLGL